MLYHKLIPAVAFDYADGDALIESENKVKFVDPTTNKEFTNPLKYTDVKQFDDAGKPINSAVDVNTLFGAMTDYFQQTYNLSGEDALRRVLRMCSGRRERRDQESFEAGEVRRRADCRSGERPVQEVSETFPHSRIRIGEGQIAR